MGTSHSGTTRYSVPQVARMLGISERAVRKQIESGKLHADREGRRWIVVFTEPTGGQESESCGTETVIRAETGGTEAEPIEAQEVIEAWRVDYNEERPHRALNQQSPAAFLASWEPLDKAAD